MILLQVKVELGWILFEDKDRGTERERAEWVCSCIFLSYLVSLEQKREFGAACNMRGQCALEPATLWGVNLTPDLMYSVTLPLTRSEIPLLLKNS